METESRTVSYPAYHMLYSDIFTYVYGNGMSNNLFLFNYEGVSDYLVYKQREKFYESKIYAGLVLDYDFKSKN